MKVVVDHKLCLKSGQCTYLHPEVFKEGPDGYPVPLVETLEGELLEGAEDAAEICPSGALALVEAASEKE
jgi:ferredoxin